MFPVAVELLTNMFQAVMFTGFLYLFFEKPQGKLIRVLPFLSCAGLLFGITTFFTLTVPAKYYLDSILFLSVMLAYSLIFLKGKLYQKVIVTFIGFGVNVLVSYTFAYIVSFFTGVSFGDLITMGTTSFRYLCLVVINFTTAILLWLILRFGSKRIRLSGAAEITAFAIVPFLCIIVLYCIFFAFQASGFNDNVLAYMLVICGVIVVIAVLTCVMLVKISRSNAMKTEYLLASQREKLYKENILATGEQIEKISHIKHDMKNKLITLEYLISNSKAEEALKLCSDTAQKLNSTYTPVDTGNPVLDSIINVEQDKASKADIDFSLEISDALSILSSADIVSLIGNLCDNAIEYLSNQPEDNRSMSLHIRKQLNFVIVTCKNRISESVLEGNPGFSTTKKDKKSHGKGMKIIRRIAKENNGEVTVSEQEDFLNISVILKIKP